MERVSKSVVRATSSPSYDWAQAALDMAQSDASSLPDLVRAANLDPFGGDLADIDLRGVDLSGQNLSGWDLRFALFDGATLTKTKLAGAKVDPVRLVAALDWRSAKLDRSIRTAANRAALLESDLKDLLLPTRTYNSLHLAGIETVGDLVRKPAWELRAMTDFGQQSLIHVQRALRRHNLMLADSRENKLAQSVPPWIDEQIYRRIKALMRKHGAVLPYDVIARTARRAATIRGGLSAKAVEDYILGIIRAKGGPNPRAPSG